MSFPADVTINLCGLNFTTQQVNTLNALERSWKAANTEYLNTELEISCKSALAKQVSNRAIRDEITKRLKLAGMRWECKEGSPTGILSMWSSTSEDLTAAERACRSGQAIRLSSESKETKESAKYNGIEAQKQAEVKAVEHSAAGGYIRWPNLCFRYLFLSEGLKGGLNNLLDRLRACYGDDLKITCPFRDKKDALVCMSVEGHPSAVDSAQSEINTFLMGIMALVGTIAVVLSGKHYSRLTRGDLGHIKKLQGDAGVHLIVDPSQSDIDLCSAKHDLRALPRSHSGQTADAEHLISDDELVLANAWTVNSRCVELGVLFTPAASAGWTWGVSCVLVIMDLDDHSVALTPSDMICLNNGGILVNVEESTGKTVLRVRISRQAPPLWSPTIVLSDSSRAQTEAIDLSCAVRRGIMEAEKLGLSGLAIISPYGLSTLPTLTDDDVKTIIVEASTTTVLESSLHCLRRIVCLEYTDLKMTDDVTVPCGGSKMAPTMLRLLHEKARLQMVSCTIPLPVSCSYTMAEANGSDDKTVVIRGLGDGLSKCLSDMKAIITSSDA